MQDTSKVVKGSVADVPGGPRRIAVIGRAGAGKTTVALQLGRALGLPVVHLDRLAWEPGWRPVDHAVFDAGHASAISADAWVLDGGYLSRSGWPERMRRAHVVVLVEAPLAVCLWRIVRRGVARPRASGAARPDLPAGCRAARPDLPAGCRDGVDLAFVAWTIAWGWRTRGALADLRRGDRELPPLIRVRSGEDPVAALAAALVLGLPAALVLGLPAAQRAVRAETCMVRPPCGPGGHS